MKTSAISLQKQQQKRVKKKEKRLGLKDKIITEDLNLLYFNLVLVIIDTGSINVAFFHQRQHLQNLTIEQILNVSSINTSTLIHQYI